MTTKRTLDSFFSPAHAKKPRLSEPEVNSSEPDQSSVHSTYPFPVATFPSNIQDTLSAETPASDGKAINNQPHLDLLYFQPFIPKSLERAIFEFLRRKLFFYRVKYKIKRGSTEVDINTPRYTTVFGVDETSRFDEKGQLVDSQSGKLIPPGRYRTCKPRPIPGCLDHLRQLTEVFTGVTYNFCLVNYYASGADSISYHSDDERFLGPEPAIASFSLGAKRDFLMKHKPKVPETGQNTKPADTEASSTPLKLPLASGDMILMRGKTQANWLHSIPKRKGGESDKGRINITFRKAMVKGGTENYYQYNVGNGEVYAWDVDAGQMRPWAGNTIAPEN